MTPGDDDPPITLPGDLPPNLARANGSANPEQNRMQEEYLKALLGGPSQGQGQQAGQATDPGTEDPMMKMMSQLMGGMQSDPNDPNAMPSFNPDDLAKATGLPSFVTNKLFGSKKAPPTPAEARQTRLWRSLHAIFAIITGLYLLFTVRRSTQTFGESPPAPATFQNPFTVFALGELFLQSARMLTAGQSGKRGAGLWLQMVKESAGDGAIMIFLLGVSSWLKGTT